LYLSAAIAIAHPLQRITSKARDSTRDGVPQDEPDGLTDALPDFVGPLDGSAELTS